MNRPQKFSVVEGSFGLRGGVPTSPDIGEQISAFREREGLSIERLAEKLDVSRQAVWYWETGRRMPRPATLAKLAALGFGGFGHERAADAAMILREAKDRLAEDLGISPDAIRILIEG